MTEVRKFIYPKTIEELLFYIDKCYESNETLYAITSLDCGLYNTVLPDGSRFAYDGLRTGKLTYNDYLLDAVDFIPVFELRHGSSFYGYYNSNEGRMSFTDIKAFNSIFTI